MYNIKDFHVGQKVILVERQYVNGIHMRELDAFEDAMVMRRGRVYVEVDYKGITLVFDTYNDFKIDRGRIDYRLYLCKQDYFDELEKSDLLKEIKRFFKDYSRPYDSMRLNDLREISRIIRVY
jgi:hypothetical protein